MTAPDKKRLKVFIARDTLWSADWLEDKFQITRDFDEADIVLFTGSTYDLDPSIYQLHQNLTVSKGAYTYSNDKDDELEYFLAVRAQKAGKIMIGVEKGAHLLTVLSGGQLIQYMHHPCKHTIETYDGSTFTVPSDHHQLMKPFNLPSHKYYIIGWANELSTMYLNGDNTSVFMRSSQLTSKIVEPEIVYYPQTKSLCFQYDVNEMNIDKTGSFLARGLVNLLVQNKLYGVMALDIPLYESLVDNFEFTKEQQDIISKLKLNRIEENAEILVN